MTKQRRLVSIVCVAALATLFERTIVYAQTRATDDLKQISFEDLMQLEVTSVSKKEETLAEAPSAIFVITQDDIRRSGLTTLAELLRLVPGLQVAHIDGNKWAVSSRGFTGRFSNKMLVIIDGRSIYTPLFSGVYWDVQDTMLADIDRIEVIRGPGAALWGANAVNGVINIVTKSARDTHGTAVSITSGSNEHVNGELRYGTSINQASDLRAFARYASHEPFASSDGSPAADGWRQLRGGVRLDWRPTPDDLFTLRGEAYSGLESQTHGPGARVPFFTERVTSDVNLAGGHVLARWSRALSARSDVVLQTYFDRTRRDDPMLGETRNTFDVDFQQHFRTTARHDIVWGSSFRTTSDKLRNSWMLRFTPSQRRDNLYSFFGHDEITLVPRRLRVTGGLKVEHNDYTQWELQPNARIALIINPQNTVWASVSRAVRTPSRAESDVFIQTAPIVGNEGIPVVVEVLGTPAFAAETLRAHEVGYRIQPTSALWLDVAVFRNLYHGLRTLEPSVPTSGATQLGPGLVVPLIFGNGMDGTSDGLEVSGRFDISSRWRLDGSYTYVRVDLRHKPESRDRLGILTEDDSPRHQARLHVAWTITPQVEIDTSASLVGELQRSRVASYTRVDARIGWHPIPSATVAVGGRNLVDPRHPEFGSTLGELPTEAPRSVYVTLGWQF